MALNEEIRDREIAFEEANDLLQIIQQNLEASGLSTRMVKGFRMIGNKLEVHFHNRVMSISISPRRYESLDFEDDAKQGQGFREQKRQEVQEQKELEKELFKSIKF